MSKIENFWQDTFPELLATCISNGKADSDAEFDIGYRAGLRSLMKVISEQAKAFEIELDRHAVDGVSLTDWLDGY